jgi:hypothetical protein
MVSPRSLVHDFAAPEEDGDLAAVPGVKKAPDVLELGLIVVFVGLRADLDFLELDDGLLLSGFLLLFLLLILEFPEIHDAADRRLGAGRHLHQVKAPLLGHAQGLGGGDDAHLLAVVRDDPHLAGANPVVAPGFTGSRIYSAYLHA